MQRADSYCMGLCLKNPNLLVPHFLMHSYLYYSRDEPVLSDEGFDWMVKELGARWDSVEHRHKGLIDQTLLKTGFYLEYPLLVQNAALALARSLSAPPSRRKSIS